MIDLYVSCFLYVPLTDFHSIYFIIVNSDAPIIARATQNGDPRAICRLPQKVASLEPPISNMDTHTYTHICMIFSAVFHICIIVQAFWRPSAGRTGSVSGWHTATAVFNDDWNNKQMMTLTVGHPIDPAYLACCNCTLPPPLFPQWKLGGKTLKKTWRCPDTLMRRQRLALWCIE